MQDNQNASTSDQPTIQQPSRKSTIWDYGPSDTSDGGRVTVSSARAGAGDNGEEGSSGPRYSFVPTLATAPGACSAEVIKLQSKPGSGSSRQSRARTRQGHDAAATTSTTGTATATTTTSTASTTTTVPASKSRMSALQQLWPQTYNSFQNRAVSSYCP